MAPNTPDDEPIVPSPGLLLDQVPAPDASDNVMIDPTHTDTLPSIADGAAITVTVAVV